ncbi:MAG: hypothetical protein GY839_13595 [candidate division Zixibacteria bacterium]|nr:hypothetical protein [candidate division Zixibacteria bacterium]
MTRNNSLIRYDQISIWLAVGLIIALFAGSSYAKGSHFDLNFQLQSVYNDNILSYSDADLDELDDTTAAANKFGIKSKDDYIIIPELDIVFKTRMAGHSLHLGVKGRYYYYQENDIKRYYRVEGYFKRYFKKGVYLQGSISFLPDHYYRNSFSLTEVYQEAEFDKMQVIGKLSVLLIDGLQANLRYKYSNKDFTPLFDDRDITGHEFKGEAIYRPGRLWKGWLSYAFTRAIGAGADNPQFARDTSFDSFFFAAGSRFYLNGLKGKGFELAGRVSYKIVYFQTDNITDIWRFGREDYRWNLRLMAKHEITSRFDIGIDFTRMTKNVEIPEEQLIESLESNSNSVYLILDYNL